MNPAAAADVTFAAALIAAGLLAADILIGHLRKLDRHRWRDADENDRHQALMGEIRKYSDEEPRYRR